MAEFYLENDGNRPQKSGNNLSSIALYADTSQDNNPGGLHYVEVND